MTHKLLIVMIFALVNVANSFSNDNEPITTPMKFEGADTLSKFYHRTSFPAKKTKNQDRILTPNYITDPRVIFSTYFGGNGYDCANSVTTDSQGNVYLVGYSGSTDLKTTEGTFQKEKKEGHDAFIAKFTKEGKALWITYLGGNRTDVAVDCICDENDNVIVLGKTNSYNFPTTDSSKFVNGSDVFVVKFSPEGNLLWSKLYGYKGVEIAEAMAKSDNGTFVITGYTSGPSNLITAETFQDSTKFGGWFDAFLTKLDMNGNVIWGTFLGGSMEDVAHGVAVDKEGNIAITGETKFSDFDKSGKNFPVSDNAFQKDTAGKEDAFVAVFTKDGQLKWATLIGGENMDVAYDVKFDSDDNVYICGKTQSSYFPVSPGAYKTVYDSFSAFLAKFDNSGNRIWATYFGGNNGEDAHSLDIDDKNNIWFTGYSMSGNLNASSDALFSNIYPDAAQLYISKFNSLGFPVWLSFYPNQGLEFSYKIKVLNTNSFLVCGETEGTSLPVTNGAFQERLSPLPSEYDGFAISVDLNQTDTIDSVTKSQNITIINDEHEKLIKILTNSEKEIIISLKITDLLGRPIIQQNDIYQNSFVVNLIDLSMSHSVYFLVITTNQRAEIYKFVY